MSHEDHDRLVQRLVLTLTRRAGATQVDPGVTIRPPLELPATRPGRHGGLPAPTEQSSGARRLALGETIAQGGMGMVVEGRQLVIGRDVAVKVVRPDIRDAEMSRALLLEAKVTGRLEHPNVVPVYDIVQSDEGHPLVVMKRIEGVAWSTLVRDPSALERHAGADDPLAFHLDVLVQVCRALELAHDRAILHRDVKPSNVMLGAFGEVYLLDWGLAVTTDPDRNPDVQSVHHARATAGTPAYMAPEQLGRDEGERPTEQTDVYLLGAVLFEIVTGSAPHHRRTMEETVESVLSSPPDAGPQPPELARILARAMAREPADRYASVAELRRDVEAFRSHLHASRLASEAGARLEALDAAMEDVRAERSETARRRVHEIFAECRFAFQEALKQWPRSEAARDGLRRTLERMAAFELEQGEPRIAARLLAEVIEPSAELRARIDEAVQADEERRRGLEDRARADDPAVGRRARIGMVALVGAVWTAKPIVEGLTHAHYPVVPSVVVLLLVLITGGLVLRRHVSPGSVNRRLLAALILFLVGELVLVVSGELAHLDRELTRRTMLFAGGIICAGVGVTLIPLLFVPAVGYGAAYVAASAWPDQRPFFEAAGNAIVSLTLIALGRRTGALSVRPRGET